MEPHFSYSLRSFLLDPMGSMQTLMGTERNRRASMFIFSETSVAQLFGSSCQSLSCNYL